MLYTSFNTLRFMSVEARRAVQVRDIMEQHFREAIRGGVEAWPEEEDE